MTTQNKGRPPKHTKKLVSEINNMKRKWRKLQEIAMIKRLGVNSLRVYIWNKR